MTEAYFTTSHVPPEPHLPHQWRVMAFDTLDSTNAALKRIVEQGGDVDEGLMMWAKTQTAGRGRQGRKWESPPGNVYVSILIAAPEDIAAAPQVGFLAAVAVVNTIEDLPRHNTASPSLMCKWPNDVLLEGQKVAGILPELVTGPDGRPWIILGIGINLEAMTLDPAAYPPTALILHHIDTTPAHVLTVFSRALASWLGRWRAEGFGVIRDAWRERGPAPGAIVSVGLSDGSVTGEFAGLDDDGALLLDARGGRKRIIAGDVLFGTA